MNTQQNQEKKQRGRKPKEDQAPKDQTKTQVQEPAPGNHEIEALRAQLEVERKLRLEAEQKSTPVLTDIPRNLGISLTLAESRAIAQKEMLDTRTQQIRSGNVPMMKGNKDDSYEFPEWEKNSYHIRLTTDPPDTDTHKDYIHQNGDTFEKKKLITQTYKTSINQFERMRKNNALKKYKHIIILHDPTMN